MTISKKLRIAVGGIVIVVIIQAILGTLFAQSIYNISQSQSDVKAVNIAEIINSTPQLTGINSGTEVTKSKLFEQQSKKAKRLLAYFYVLTVIGFLIVAYLASVIVLYVTREISPNIKMLIAATERVVAGDLGERVKITSGDELARLADSFNAMMIVLDLAYEQASQLSKESHQRFVQTITAFVKAIEAKDVYTRGHSENVAYYVTRICEAFEWPEEDIENMRIAALLHDIGKIGIKENVLNKKSGLTDDEYLHVKEHPEIARNILGSFPSLEALANVAVHHHERYDGQGYPDGLEGEEIPFGARMLAVADAFDAMTTARTYKPPMPIDKALAELERGSGTQFDPMLVMVFVELVREGKIIVDEEQRAS